MRSGTSNLLGVAIRDYFTDHLPRLRGTSPHTVHSYRDSMVLLLRFLARQRDKPITGFDLTDLDPPCGFRAKWGTDSDGKWGAITTQVGRGFDGKWGTFRPSVVMVPHLFRNGAPSVS
jgi:hypothetical protein